MVEDVRKKVVELLSKDDSGHGMAHINRVVDFLYHLFSEENAPDGQNILMNI